VEPDDLPGESAEQQQVEQPPVGKNLIPEIVAEFRDTVVISDEGEPTAEIPLPTTDAGPLPSTSATVPTSGSMRASASATSVDVTARKPTRPTKPHISIWKLETTLLQMQPVPLPSPEAAQQARRRLKTVSSLQMANTTIDYHKSTEQLTDEFSCQYSLKPQEKYNVQRKMKKMRLGQKALALHIRSKFPLNYCKEMERQFFLDWLEAETRLIANRHSDSDDNTAELGLGIEGQP